MEEKIQLFNCTFFEPIIMHMSGNDMTLSLESTEYRPDAIKTTTSRSELANISAQYSGIPNCRHSQ
ncbi:hypothetical protein CASFOL_030098 [Castilleja foliolosa]|uniref:Uncharacterized protein n=1 Tax=Castilleja foliolosa TaxID=1961234 RepID=A0ABD3CAD1_9LAMI